GQILESSLRGVAERIEAVTGMDFDRFTRSMLLAQGEFAKFLQAAPDERAPILEQITGTALYSEISMGVHARRGEEQKKRDLLQAELSRIEPLDPAAEEQLQQRVAAASAAERVASQQIAKTQQAMAWLEGLERLSRELQQIAEAKRDWEIRQQAFAGERVRLQRATQTLELAGEYASLLALRQAQEADQRAHSQSLDSLPIAETGAQSAAEAVRQAEAEWEQSRERQQAGGECIRQVRALDVQLREREAPIQALVTAIAEQEGLLARLRTQQEGANHLLARQQQDLTARLARQEATQGDASLVEELAGIREQFALLNSLHAEWMTKGSEVRRAGQQLAEATRLQEEMATTRESRRAELARIQEEIAQAEAARQQLLGGDDVTTWRQRLSALQEKKSLLEQLGTALLSWREAGQRLEVLQRQRGRLESERAILDPALQAQGERVTHLKEEQARLEQALTRLNGIHAYAEARQQLEDGLPCPLCGAAEHPFATGNVPVPDTTRQALTQVREELQTVGAELLRGKVRIGEINTELAQLALRLEGDEAQVARAESLFRQQTPLLGMVATGEELTERLPHLLTELTAQMAETSRGVQAAERLERELGRLRPSLEQARAQEVLAETQWLEASHRRHAIEQAQQRTTQEADALALRVEQKLVAVQQGVMAYGVEGVTVARLASVLATLTQRRAQWIGLQQEALALERQLATLVVETRQREGEMESAARELARQRERWTALQAGRDLLRQERQALFADGDPDREERTLAAAVLAAEQRREAARQAEQQATQALARWQNRLTELQQLLAQRAEPLREAEAALVQRLGAFNFVDEADYRAAALPEEKRRILLQQARQLTDEETELAARLREKSLEREVLQQQRLTEHSHGELAQACTEQMGAQRQWQQEVGMLRQQLAENAHKQERQRACAEAVAAQQREWARWDALHALIGSADGKKYRNFAQGLTFERMVRDANRQLQQMTDRYLLIRDSEQPLDLNVMDGYQAGEIRSTRNLSGGESFIVSLALALGLSCMASRNVRVDSLFLDEGFGTLDEESLETALETLAGLHRVGKLIGIISHVPALKERITARIEVIPQAGGRSVLRGPGCSRGDGE
ncbi:MAG: hypothetical protein H7836_11990, partial [Magnetococcus sp. YQC-3]